MLGPMSSRTCTNYVQDQTLNTEKVSLKTAMLVYSAGELTFVDFVLLPNTMLYSNFPVLCSR